jgi:predicted DNA binding CopG/RHH family protein
LGQVIGEKAGASMTNKISYSDGPMEEVRVVEDFLPPPEELAFREETVKVTIALSKASVEFFKHEAAKHQVSYQKMIRRLLDEYALRHTG